MTATDDEVDTSLEASQPETHFIPQEDDEETLWSVIEILAENKKQYKVLWDGVDPATGKPWKPSWVAKHDCTDDLVVRWKKEKAKLKKGTKTVQGKGKGRADAAPKKPKAKGDSPDYGLHTTRNSRSVSRTQDETGEQRNAQVSSSPGPVVRKVGPPKRKRIEPSSKPQPIRHASTVAESDDDSRPPEITRIGPPHKKRKLNVQASAPKASAEIVPPARLKTYAKSQRSRRAPTPDVESEDEPDSEEAGPIAGPSTNLREMKRRNHRRVQSDSEERDEDEADVLNNEPQMVYTEGEDSNPSFPTSPELHDLFLGKQPTAEEDPPNHDPGDIPLDDPLNSQSAPTTQNSRDHIVIPETQSTHEWDDTVLIDPQREPPPAYTSRANLDNGSSPLKPPTKKRKLSNKTQDIDQYDTIDSFSTQPSHILPVPTRPKERTAPPKSAKGPLRPVPQLSPSAFRPYLPQPTSPIESFSPDRPHAAVRRASNRHINERLPHLNVAARSDETDALEAAYVDYSGGEIDVPSSPIAGNGSVSRLARPPPGTVSTQQADIDSQSQIILVKDSQPANFSATLAEKDEEIARLMERVAVLERARVLADDDEMELLKTKNASLQDEVRELRSEVDLLQAEGEDPIALAQLEEQANCLRMAEMEISELREALQSIRTTFSLSASSASPTDSGPLNPVTALLQKRLGKTEEELRKWKGICQVLQEKDERTDDGIRKRAAEHPELMAAIAVLRSKLATLESESEGLEMRTEALELDKEAMEQEIEQLRTQLDSERAGAQERLAAAERDDQARLLRHEAERAELSKKLALALQELEQGRAASASALDAERATKAQLENRLDEIKVDLAMAREEAESQAQRSAELELLKLDHAVLQDTLASLVEQRDQLELSCTGLESKVSLLEDKHHAALQAAASLTTSAAECDALRVRLSELETERNALRVESARLQQSVDDSKLAAAAQSNSHDREIEKLTRERNELTSKVEHGNLEVASFKGQVEGLSAQLQELQDHATPLEDELEVLKKDKKRLEQEKESLRLQRDGLNGQMRALSAEAGVMRDGYSRVQEVERRINDLVVCAPVVNEQPKTQDSWVCVFRHQDAECLQRFDNPQTLFQHAYATHYPD